MIIIIMIMIMVIMIMVIIILISKSLASGEKQVGGMDNFTLRIHRLITFVIIIIIINNIIWSSSLSRGGSHHHYLTITIIIWSSDHHPGVGVQQHCILAREEGWPVKYQGGKTVEIVKIFFIDNFLFLSKLGLFLIFAGNSNFLQGTLPLFLSPSSLPWW